MQVEHKSTQVQALMNQKPDGMRHDETLKQTLGKHNIHQMALTRQQIDPPLRPRTTEVGD